MWSIGDAPDELASAVREFFPETEWDHAVSISYLESGWNALALRDTTDSAHSCGADLTDIGQPGITAEVSISWFQINSCNFPNWISGTLYNTRQNVGTAHMLWADRGWQPWLFSARTLGLLP
jgi:hypothetical protein